MKLCLLFALAFFSNCVLICQHNLGFRAGVGTSLLTTQFKTTSGDDKQLFWPQPTGSVGVFYSFTFSNNLVVLTNPNYFYMRGKETMSFPVSDQNGPTGTFVYDTLIRNFHTAAIPVNIGIVSNRWTYLIGGQFNYYFNRNGSERGSYTDRNGVTSTWQNDFKEDQYGTDKYDYGLSGGAIYRWDDKFSFDVQAFAGLHNLINLSISDSWKWKVYLLTFGVNYSLYRSPVAIVQP